MHRTIQAAAILAAIGLGISALPAIAQPPARTPDGEPLSVQELEARLESLRREVQRDKEALAERKQLYAAELAELRQQRSAAADRLLSAQIEHEENAADLETLRQQAQEATESASKLQDSAKSLLEALRASGEQLRLHLSEVPGSETTIGTLRSLADQTWSPESAPGAADAQAAGQLLSILDSAHRETMEVKVEPATIFTASGRSEKVQLLSIGHAKFAYQTIEGDRIGLALASPRDASGYRWSERLSPQDQNRMRQAIAAIGKGTAGIVEIPIEPTGRVGPESLEQDLGLMEQFESGGLVMYPLAGLAIVVLLLITERCFVLFVGNGHGDRLTRQVLEACRHGRFDRAQALCQRGRGAVCRVLLSCLGRRELGQRAMEDSIQEQLLHELPRLQRFMGGIAMLAAIAPLLGLLGTVTGIIHTFEVIRRFGNANPSLMAGGISEALITTAAGLIIAVPVLIVHSMLRGRSDRIIADAERHAAKLLTTLVHGPPARHVAAAKVPSSPNGNGAPNLIAETGGKTSPEPASRGEDR